MAKSFTDTTVPASETHPLPLAWQAGFSVVIILHLLAVFTPPFTAATRSSAGSSPVNDILWGALNPYIQATFLNHAYFFFAPDPGPSHLVRYEVYSEGKDAITGRFPDKQEHWPRLLYHRHFMLSESMTERFAPPNGPPEPQRRDDSRQAGREYTRAKERWEIELAAWRDARARYESLQQSVKQHLQHRYQGNEVSVVRVEHRPLTPDEFRLENMNLTDAATYRNLPEVTPSELLPVNITPRP
jgi:hypothetical protein